MNEFDFSQVEYLVLKGFIITNGNYGLNIAVPKEDAGGNLYARKLFPGRERARENCSLVGEKAFRLFRSRRRKVATAIVSSNRFFLKCRSSLL